MAPIAEVPADSGNGERSVVPVPLTGVELELCSDALLSLQKKRRESNGEKKRESQIPIQGQFKRLSYAMKRD